MVGFLAKCLCISESIRFDNKTKYTETECYQQSFCACMHADALIEPFNVYQV